MLHKIPIFFICLIYVVCPFLALEAVTFHTILIGDTRDKELRKVIQKDLKHMEKHLDEVFEYLDVDWHQQLVYTGRDTNSTILQDLKNLHIQPDDIVFFYFSGHGFYTGKSKTECWPTLYFSQEDVGIDQSYIIQLILEQQPRLFICLADCCNNILEEDDDVPEIIAKRFKIEPKREKKSSGLQKLFLEAKGVVLIASAGPEYYAEGTNEKGSCFTNCYIKTFNQALQSHPEKVSWDSILSKTQHMLWEAQKPQYQLMFH